MKKSLSLLFFIFFFVLFVSCQTNPLPDRDFRADMRAFVIKIAHYARDTAHNGAKSNFIIIPQNGQELITLDGTPEGTLVKNYVSTINGTGREDLYYGYTADNTPTPPHVSSSFEGFLDRLNTEGIIALVTDYCSTYSYMDDSYSKNAAKGYLSFAAPERGLNVIPNYPSFPYNVNSEDVSDLSRAKNFLYLINGENFSTKQAFINTVKATSYDTVIMDAFFNGKPFSYSDIAQLKTKQNGGTRLVLAYLSIGEAEDYRYYWKTAWKKNPPGWLEKENPEWKGNYKVRYWEQEWQEIIVSGKNSYMQKIMNAGFDGVYLDLIDAFEYFENE